MGIVAKEKSFPRGGRKPAVYAPKKGRFSLFDKSSNKGPRTKNVSRKRNQEFSSSFQVSLKYVESLTYKNLSEGMLVLGCVREIQDYGLLVCLPGRLLGYVPISNISMPYSKFLTDLVQGKANEQRVPQLEEIFQRGQTVVTRVLEIIRLPNSNPKITLSLVPDVIHSDLSHRSLVTNSVVIAAVKSQEDNGYVMDTGIANVRAFLKLSSSRSYETIWNEGRSLEIGHLVRCLVVKSDITAFSTTLELSADPHKVSRMGGDSLEFSLDTLLPGTLFTASVSKVLQNGLEMTFGTHFKGYVTCDHLSSVWAAPDDFAVGDEHQVRVLYVLPTVKFVYLSMKKCLCCSEPAVFSCDRLKVGDTVKGAKIKQVDGHGVTVRMKTALDKKIKGFVPIHQCSLGSYKKETSKSLREEINEKFVIGSKHKCKVLSFDYMSELFFCTLDKQKIKAKFLSAADLELGMRVMCYIKEHVKNGVLVAIDATEQSIMAFVPSAHIGNIPLAHPEKKYEIGSKHAARVLQIQGKRIQLTLKSTLVESSIHPLCHFEDVKQGMKCEGVVMLIQRNGMLVTFYGEVKGWLSFPSTVKEDDFYIGQLLKCYVHSVDPGNKRMSLYLKVNSCKITQPYRVTVTDCTEESLKIKGDFGSGILPAQHLTDNPTLAKLLLKTYTPGDVIESAFCFSESEPPIFTLRPSLITYFTSEEEEVSSSTICERKKIPCTVEKIEPASVLLQLLLPRNKTKFLNLKDVTDVSVNNTESLNLVKHQGLIGCILNEKKMTITTRLSRCWDYSIEPSVSLLCNYWKEYDRIVTHLKQHGSPLANLVPGDRVRGEVVSIDENVTVVSLECGTRGIVKPELSNYLLSTGDVVEGTVLFVDFIKNSVELVINSSIMNRINKIQDGKLDAEFGIGSSIRGEVLLIRQEMIMVVLKSVGRQQLAYIPTRCHINDLIPDLSRYEIGAVSKMIIQNMEGGRIICVLQRFTYELGKSKVIAMIKAMKHKKKDASNSVQVKSYVDNSDSGIQDVDISEEESLSSKTVKNSDSVTRSTTVADNEEFEVVTANVQVSKGVDLSSSEEDILDGKRISNNYDSDISEEQNRKVINKRKKRKKRKGFEQKSIDIEECSRKKLKLSDQNEMLEEAKNKEPVQVNSLSLSTGFIWDATPSLLPAGAQVSKSDSSSDEEELQNKKQSKRKKLSRGERRILAREEEEQLRTTEQKFMDLDRGPESADDFDRLVLSSPNSSLCWIKYMAFHLQATEIEKARAVAQRALSIISFREEQEKLNVWCALLNLENLYGTQESLNKVLEEAVRTNDSFKVYIRMLQIYADSGKTQEAEKLASVVTKKFRENKDAWLEAGEVLLKIGKLEQARALMQRALTSLEKKVHVEVISKFAQLENRFGEPERAQTLMEHILTSYPKRVDIWNCYVDMLVKSKHLEAARQVLERGVAQKLPARKMKSIFAKFLQFEECHGTPENARKVRQMALDYVEATTGSLEEEQD